jgi:hypothetical protein
VACPTVRDTKGNLVPACVQKLPDGFSLTADGTVTGRRDLVPGNKGDPLTSNFMVRVVDSENRVDLRGMSLTLRNAATPPVQKHGCGCGAAGAVPFIAGLAALPGLRRRRKTS